MRVFDWKELPPVGGVIALGSFDGVHIGHQRLLEFGSRYGTLRVLTFTPHPRVFLKLVKENFLLSPDDEKEELLKTYGVEETIFVKFTEEFSRMTPEEFVEKVIYRTLEAEKVVVGFDYHFGRGGLGHAEDLRRIGGRLGIEVFVFPEVYYKGKIVKSTLIRNLIKQGDVESGMEFLGRPYSIKGKVVKGEGLGKKIGFPTTNLMVNRWKVLPATGVYGVRVYVRGGVYPGLLYIGNKPTVGGGEKSVEVHIIDFNDDVYGMELRVETVIRIRDEVRFESIDALRRQIVSDRVLALKKLKEVRYGA